MKTQWLSAPHFVWVAPDQIFCLCLEENEKVDDLLCSREKQFDTSKFLKDMEMDTTALWSRK